MTLNLQPWKILDKRRFLLAAMEEFAGDARISFEGDLRATRLDQISSASNEETAALKMKYALAEAEFRHRSVGSRLHPDNHVGH